MMAVSFGYQTSLETFHSAITSVFDFKHPLDVVTAFLNGKLDEEQQPDGYIKPGKEHLVCKLKKSLYGLKQSPGCWNKAFQEYMESIVFEQSAVYTFKLLI